MNLPVEVHRSVEVEKGPPTYTAAFGVRGSVQTTGVGEELVLNPRYFASIPGILKLIQVVSLPVSLSDLSLRCCSLSSKVRTLIPRPDHGTDNITKKNAHKNCKASRTDDDLDLESTLQKAEVLVMQLSFGAGIMDPGRGSVDLPLFSVPDKF